MQSMIKKIKIKRDLRRIEIMRTVLYQQNSLLFNEPIDIVYDSLFCLFQLPTYALENALLHNNNVAELYLGNNSWTCDCHFTPSFQV